MIFQPSVLLFGAHSGDVFFGVFRACAAVCVQEEVAAFGLIKAFFVSVGIAEVAESYFLNKRRSFRVVNFVANCLLHITFLSFFRFFPGAIVQ